MQSNRDKIMGCWLGKSVGGTLGMPFEGQDGPHSVTFYDPIPTEMIANDDLDLQILWACIMDKMDSPSVDRNIFAAAWIKHVGFPWDEYGVAIRNLHLGIKPPLTGSYDNYFINGMGAAIRSEIWACLAPGDPELAAKYAYEDACVDHAGEGVWATVFLASLESMAFVKSNPNDLLDLSIAQLPDTSLVKKAVIDTRKWWNQDGDWMVVREKILDDYGHENFTDVTMNMAFIVLAWLASGNDFSKAICIATNCGKDTDCTAATLGALMGIIDPDGIDEKWLKPIGDSLVLSPEITDVTPPDTLGEFTDLIISLKDRLAGKAPNVVGEEQSLDEFHIEVDMTFIESKVLEELRLTDKFVFPAEYQKAKLSGVFSTMDTSDFNNDVMLLRYHLRLENDCAIRLVFNTPQSCAVWTDGTPCFARKGGRMAPSPHRVPNNQFADITLVAGEHEVVAAIKRPATADQAEWIIIAADAKTKQWIPRAFM